MRQYLLDMIELPLSPAYSSHGCLDKIFMRSSQSALKHGALALADGLVGVGLVGYIVDGF